MLVTSIRPSVSVSGAVALVLLMAVPRVEGSPHTEVYEITSGTFSEIGGGWVYQVDHDLPDEYQHFIELTIDGDVAEMDILDAQLQRWQEYDPFPPTGDFPFDSGVIEGDGIRFVEPQETSLGSASLAYMVTLQDDTLTLNGSLTVENPLCFDCPTSFYHTDVRATLVPEPPVLALLLFGMFALCMRRRSLA